MKKTLMALSTSALILFLTCCITMMYVYDLSLFHRTTLTIITKVKNDNSGIEKSSDFTTFINSKNALPQSMSGSEAGIRIKLKPGEYTVTQNKNLSYETVLSYECSGIIKIGENRVCNILNDDIFTGIILRTIIINDNNREGTSKDMNIDIINNDVTKTTRGSKEDINISLSSGSFSVNPQKQRYYAITMEGDCEGVLESKKTTMCTVIYDDLPLKVELDEDFSDLSVEITIKFATKIADTKTSILQKNEYLVVLETLMYKTSNIGHFPPWDRFYRFVSKDGIKFSPKGFVVTNGSDKTDYVAPFESKEMQVYFVIKEQDFPLTLEMYGGRVRGDDDMKLLKSIEVF